MSHSPLTVLCERRSRSAALSVHQQISVKSLQTAAEAEQVPFVRVRWCAATATRRCNNIWSMPQGPVIKKKQIFVLTGNRQFLTTFFCYFYHVCAKEIAQHEKQFDLQRLLNLDCRFVWFQLEFLQFIFQYIKSRIKYLMKKWESSGFHLETNKWINK